MARLRTVNVAAINIRVHPHPDGKYASLLNAAFMLRKAIQVQGDRHMLLERLDTSQEGEGLISGTIARFTKIDADLPWFNSVRIAKADDEDVKKINIPNNLQPNYMSMFFQFDLKNHLLIFEQRNADSFYINPKIALYFFQKLLQEEKILEEFGPVKITLVTDKEAASAILALKGIRRLRIILRKPNPDEMGDYDSHLEERMKNLNVDTIEENFVATDILGVQPDENIKLAVNAATKNGDVEAVAPNEDGRLTTHALRDHPVIGGHRYDPDLRTNLEAFKTAAIDLVRRVVETISRDGIL